ncbi:MAG: periplasmic heavy metal sensor [Deltaproteobacteria bacterium]|nr:MAG: periplasmic heavy metal sensor [Deltaproteobacteria bacterium]
MRRKSILAPIVLLLSLVLAGWAPAGAEMKGHMHGKESGEHHGGPGMMKGRHCDDCGMRGNSDFRPGRFFGFCLKNAEALELSQGQIEKLREIHREQRKKLIRLRAEIDVVGVDLKEELDRDVPDMEKVENLLKKQEELKTKFRLELIRTRAESMKVLIPEQRAKLKKLMEEKMSGMMGEE